MSGPNGAAPSWALHSPAACLRVEGPDWLAGSWPEIVPHLPGVHLADAGQRASSAEPVRIDLDPVAPRWPQALLDGPDAVRLPERLPAGDIRRLLNALFHRLHLEQRVVTLHGVAVGRADRRVLLLGGHGAGKTLTALALHGLGWTPLAGDTAIMAVRHSRPPELLGGTSSFLVRVDEFRRQLPWLASGFVSGILPTSPAVKVDLGPALTEGGGRPLQQDAGPVDLAVLVHAEARTQALPVALDRHTAVSAFYEASGHQLDRVLQAVDLPLRLLEPFPLARERLRLVQVLGESLPMLSARGSPHSIAVAVERALQRPARAGETVCRRSG